MKLNLKILSFAGCLILIVSGCNKDLDRTKLHSQTPDQVYETMDGYRMAFAKVYGAFALTGNSGPTSGDIQGIDPGTSDFFRLFWNAQELSTDEAVVGWGDAGLPDFHNMNWSASNPFLTGLYYRAMYQITLVNDFLRQSTEEKVASRGFEGQDAEEIEAFTVEARFLRAYQYWVLMDIFGNPPFITDENEIGDIPVQIKRADLFNYIEGELKDIDPQLKSPKTNEYGRADQAAVWALLARMYLNAGVYTGQERYTDAITYASKVINAGYKLIPDYSWLMLADNDKNTDEFILTINYDGLNTQSYGGTNYLIHAAVGGDMIASEFGIEGGWAGLRMTRSIPDLFPDYDGTEDKRAMFFTQGQNIDIDDISQFNDGVGVTKFKNITRDGQRGSNQEFADVDMPIFRLAEMYLIYAESVLRGGAGGDIATAIGYINLLRERAYQNGDGNIREVDLTLDFILDERGRELYWEAFRRSDLIRYGRFSSNSYLWQWKGGTKTGTGVPDYHNLYPLPSQDLSSNNQLEQNVGY